MILKGKSRKDGAALADYLLSEGRFAANREDNERIEIWEGSGVAEGATLHTLLHSFERSAGNTQCTKPLYHAQMRTAEGEPLDRKRWLYAVTKLEARLGLTGHHRVMVAHTKDGHEHLHVVWNRLDYETGRIAELRYDARKRVAVARELEQEFALRPLSNKSNGKLSAKEQAIARRRGKDPQAIKKLLQTCWQGAGNGQEFIAQLAAYGMVLAKGDKRGYLAVDPDGGFYLVSRTTGSREKEVREKLRDLDRDRLPTLEEARDRIKEPYREPVPQPQTLTMENSPPAPQEPERPWTRERER